MTKPEISLGELLALHELAPLAWNAGNDAADFLFNERPDDLVIESKSTATDTVTLMDRGAEERIVEAVLTDRPDDGILGEEGSERTGSSGVRWIIDPLDGTVNYLNRLPNWAVSIGVEVRGVVEVGVVIAPALREAYVAVRGSGAWSVTGDRAVRIRASVESTLSMSLVATGFSYDSARRVQQANDVTSLIAQVRDIRRLGAASVDFCWTAVGRLEAYYESGLNAWDIAAGALIAREAGAHVQSLDGESDYEGTIVAAAPAIARPLMNLLRSIQAS